MKRPLWLLIAVAAAALNVTGTAQASYPGTNGRIAFVRDVCDPNTCVDQIYTVNSDGSNLVNVSGSATISVWAPRWTPGGKILFDRSTGGLDQVFQMNGDGTGVTQISNGSFNDDQPSPSPAAVGKIAFVHAQNIWTMSNTGTNRTQLSTDALDDTSPVWSPNGANIAYGRYFYNGSNYVTQVVRIPASGGTATIVAQFTSCCGVGGLDWSPDGTTVAFSFEGNLYTAPADGSGTPVEQRDNVYNASYSPTNRCSRWTQPARSTPKQSAEAHRSTSPQATTPRGAASPAPAAAAAVAVAAPVEHRGRSPPSSSHRPA